jgi:hypothetical protein
MKIQGRGEGTYEGIQQGDDSYEKRVSSTGEKVYVVVG